LLKNLDRINWIDRIKLEGELKTLSLFLFPLCASTFALRIPSTLKQYDLLPMIPLLDQSLS